MNKRELIKTYEHQLTLKKYSDSTIQSYLNGLHKFIDYWEGWHITSVNGQPLSGFLVLCKKRDGYSSMKQMVASLRFLYEQVVRKDIDFDFNIGMKKPSRIPVVLSLEEVERFLNSFTNLKHKAIFTLIY